MPHASRSRLTLTLTPLVGKENITCGFCGSIFERSKEYASCCNCFVCTGCEIYYCPECDQEIVIVPVKKMRSRTE